MIITVLDWDDTLFSNTFRHIPDMAYSIINVVETVIDNCDRLLIITNSSEDWISYCLQYLPGCKKVLEDIEIISTSEYGMTERHRKSPVFNIVLNKYLKKKGYHHLISVGDSEYDRLAGMYIKKVYDNVVLKNVKFVPKPDLNLLLSEHDLFLELFLDIKDCETDLDLIFTTDNL